MKTITSEFFKFRNSLQFGFDNFPGKWILGSFGKG